MFRSRGRISGSNLARVDGSSDHFLISGGVYNPIDNLLMAGRKSGYYLNSLSARWEEYIDPNTDGNPYSISFSADGMQCFIVCNEHLETYSLSEPYGTPTYVSKVNLGASSTSNPEFGSTNAFFHGSFTPDGMYFFCTGDDDDYPQTFSLSSAYDLSSVLNIGKDSRMLMGIHTDTGSTETVLYGHDFGNSGLKMYTVGVALDRIAQYTLSTAYDVTTASYDGYKDISSINGGPSSITWKPDGTTYYMTDYSGDDVHQISVSTNWDVTSTNTLVNTLAVDDKETVPMDVRFKTDDGTKMFVMGRSGDGIDTYTLSTGWDISTASWDRFDSLSLQNDSPTGLDFSPDGTKMIVAGTTDDELLYYTLSSAWDISSRTYVGEYETSPIYISGAYQNGNTKYWQKSGISVFDPVSCRYINDGDGVSILDYYKNGSNYGAKVVNHKLGESYNALSIQDGLLTDYRIQADGEPAYDVQFNNDGTKVYVVNSDDDKIYQWTLDTPYTFSSCNYGMTYDGKTSAMGDTFTRGISFNDVGDRLFVIGYGQDKILEYTVSTAWDLMSTRTLVAEYSVVQQVESDNIIVDGEGVSMDVVWTNSGIFFVGYGLDNIYKINFVDK